MSPLYRAKSAKFRRSLNYSFWDGVFASIQFGIVEQFATPIALFMGANSAAIGLLSFVRSAFVSIIQVWSADTSSILRSRKKLVTFSVFTAALLWVPTYFVPFLFPGREVPVFIILFAVTSSFNTLATPAWASLMADYIPHNKRGRYFGWRGMVLGLVYCLSLLIAGLFLHFYHSISLFWSFGAMVVVASASRFISWFFLARMYEPKWRARKTDYFSFADFLRRFPKGNFIRFSIFSAFLLLGVALASPFFAVYLLQELKIDYFSYTLLMGATVLTTYTTQRYWGDFADRYGNVKIFKLTAFFICLVPFLWLFSHNLVYLFVIQLLAGFVWAGFNLSSSNFIYDVAVSTKRERCISYFNFMSGLGLGIGALCGGYLYRILPAFLGSSFFSLLILSGILRLAGSMLINAHVKEVRNVQEVRSRTLLMDISGVRSLGLLSKELLFKRK